MLTRIRFFIVGLVVASFIAGCQTTDVAPTTNKAGQAQPPVKDSPYGNKNPYGDKSGDIANAQTPSAPSVVSQPAPSHEEVEIDPNNRGDSAFDIEFHDYLDGWHEADLDMAYQAFLKNCPIWQDKPAQDYLSDRQREFGRYEDWQEICEDAPAFKDSSRQFFEYYFLPETLLSTVRDEGLLTGYYEPQILARRQPDKNYSEPIMAFPKNETLSKRARKDITQNERDYHIFAYGRPIDVFFMQIQGSGRLKLIDDAETIIRAAYAGNNGHTYKSIGSELIKRGALTKDTASKQSIEDWMIKAGPLKARELMNRNPRYIFFEVQKIASGEGPLGAMGVPLTAMGSFATDPKARPYGVPVWFETILPQEKGDFRGEKQNLLVIAQDTGSAIRGENRGDLFFGSGDFAGELAGVMKHPVHMTHLLPRDLVLRQMKVASR